MKPLFKVNLLQGTDSIREFSKGNTLPLVARPWGIHHWSLQTGKTPWTFNRHLTQLQGIRLTHQPSPWMKDYGSLTILPFSGPLQEEIQHQASAYSLRKTVLHPHYLKTEFLRYGILVEMTPSERGALFVFTRQGSDSLRLRFSFDGEHTIEGRPGRRRIEGQSRDHNGGVPEDFALHFIAEFSESPMEFLKTADGGVLTFAKNVDRLELRLAASFISPEMAQTAWTRELAGETFESLLAKGAAVWNDLLGRIEIEGHDDAQERTFYSCLYRCLLFPRFLDEPDETGRILHYSPTDGIVREGSLCADSGFWDTYRTLYPLLTLVYPDVLRRMLEGWLNACRECGWSPKWPSPGPRDCMIGTHFDVLVADVIAKGITDWNVEEAFHYLWRDATEPGCNGFFGRHGLENYIRLGYVPCDKLPYAVSCTLDYAYDDFCVARVARHLGYYEKAESLIRRSLSYRNIFDPSVGFMRGRTASGEWETPFREFQWGGSYIEGGPWQHSFNVPHDPDGLIALFGGPAGLCRKLDAMLASPARYEAGSYGFEIHEMTEMALAGFGQYAHSNQPVHNFLFLYALAGEAGKTEHWTKRVATGLYTPGDLPGDEDNGEMSAWYVFVSLGLYPFCPGKPDYVFFKPLVRSATLHTPDASLRLCPIESGVHSHQELLRRSTLLRGE